MVGPGSTDLRLRQAPIIEDVLLERCAFRAERATINRVIGIAFHMDDLRRCVLCLVAEGMNDNATTHRTIWACAARLSCARDSEALCLGVDRRKIEAECRSSDSPNKADLDEGSPRDFH